MYQQLGDRMKLNYEKPYNFQLPWRMPIIVRLDGRNFHTYTKGMKRPFDDNFIANMKVLALHLCNEVSTTVFAYCQSDEISLLLHPYKKLDSEPFFRNEVQKIASVTAGLASSFFAVLANIQKKDVKFTVFDARCFVLPEDEVCNYFIWRQLDASRNSIRQVAQTKFSHKELQGKNTKEMQEMMFQKDKTNWNDLPTYQKRGFAVYKEKWLTQQETVFQGKDGKPHTMKAGQLMSEWKIDVDIPEFSKDRNFIEKCFLLREE